MITRKDFPGAPIGSYVCEEGWLVVGDQAWTVEEWLSPLSIHRGGRMGRNGRPLKYENETDRAEAKRRFDREYYRRRRERVA